MAKGQDNERAFCKALSLWWSGGKRQDIFWRTHGSGGRAVVRSWSGQQTAGQYGDICANDKIGEPFTDFMTVELKKGYSREALGDLVDKPPGLVQQVWEQWIQKAHEAHVGAGSCTWGIIAQRTRRLPILVGPASLWQLSEVNPTLTLNTYLRFEIWSESVTKGEKPKCRTEYHKLMIGARSWSEWLGAMTPERIRDITRRN